jgi:hypothetical protein
LSNRRCSAGAPASPDCRARLAPRAPFAKAGRDGLHDAGRVQPASRGLLAGLDDHEREQIASLLGKLLGTLEHAGPDEVFALRLGLVLDPAPAADERRRAGRPRDDPRPARAPPRPERPAAGAGLRTGDLVAGVDGRRIRTHADLRCSVEAAGTDGLVLDVVRGARRQRIRVPVAPP